jgi:hypothetical protein
MEVEFRFGKDFQNEAVLVKESFKLIIDLNETVENLKVLISLKFNDLDPNHFLLSFKNRPIPNDSKLIDIPIRQGDIITIVNHRENHALTYIFVAISILLLILLLNSAN